MNSENPLWIQRVSEVSREDCPRPAVGVSNSRYLWTVIAGRPSFGDPPYATSPPRLLQQRSRIGGGFSFFLFFFPLPPQCASYLVAIGHDGGQRRACSEPLSVELRAGNGQCVHRHDLHVSHAIHEKIRIGETFAGYTV